MTVPEVKSKYTRVGVGTEGAWRNDEIPSRWCSFVNYWLFLDSSGGDDAPRGEGRVSSKRFRKSLEIRRGNNRKRVQANRYH